MVAPIKGPTRYATPTGMIGQGAGSTYETVDRYGQSKPYTLPLPYTRKYQTVIQDTATGTLAPGGFTTGADSSWRTAPRIGTTPVDVLAMNRALAQFQEKLGNPSLWMATLLQCNQALGMIADRAEQGIRLLRAVKRRDEAGLWVVLRDIAGDKTTLSRPVRSSQIQRLGSSLSNTSLEVSFGWLPLISDVSAACETLSRDFDRIPVRGFGRHTDDTHRKWSIPPYDSYTEDTFMSARCVVGGKARITNPNLYLAHQLGLVNPLETLWEIAPWSFVVDYVYNVGQFLGGLTPYLGITFEDTYSSTAWVGYRYTTSRSTWGTGGTSTQAFLAKDAIRTLGLPTVKLARRPLTMSHFRALTSWSLLVQQVQKRL